MDGTPRTFLAVVLVTIVALAGGSALVAFSHPRLPPASFAQGSTVAADSQEGLLLEANVNATSIPAGGSIALTILEQNPAPDSVVVQAADAWGAQGLSLGPCGLVFPFGFKLLKGHYTSLPAVAAPAVQLYPGGTYACPMEVTVQSFTFAPMSTNASLGGYCSRSVCTTLPMSFTATISLAYSGSSQNGTPLPPGNYTVVVGDEWGAIGVLFFSVRAAG